MKWTISIYIYPACLCKSSVASYNSYAVTQKRLFRGRDLLLQLGYALQTQYFKVSLEYFVVTFVLRQESISV